MADRLPDEPGGACRAVTVVRHGQDQRVVDRPGPAYSCAILGSGALGCTTAAVVSLFKPIYGTEIDKWRPGNDGVKSDVPARGVV